MEKENKIKQELEEAGYDFATAIATQAAIDAGAACGQLSLIIDEEEDQSNED